MPVVLPRHLAALLVHVLVCGSLSCGGESSPQGEGGAAGGGAGGGAGGSGPCPAPNRLLEDGRCLAPGVQDNGCPAGELGLEDGSCQPAGVPPELCADGFEPLDQGCEPILPPEPCPPGLLAVPGDSTCREVAPCGQGRWGDIPIDGSTQHVDTAYVGGNNDGTADRPWTTIGEAITAAAPAALVAIAAGSYAEDVDITGKPVELWGVCPAAVEVVGSGTALAAVFIGTGAGGTQVRNLAIVGDAVGLVLSGSQDVVLDQLWVHDNASRGIAVEQALGPTTVTISGSLIEQNHEIGLIVGGSEATVEGTVVRKTQPRTSNQTGGAGIVLQYNPNVAARASLTLRASLLEQNHDLGVLVAGSDATIEGTVVRNTFPQPSDQMGGKGIAIQDTASGAERANVMIHTSLFEQNHDTGVFVSGSDATVEGTVVRNTLPRASDQADGRGIVIQHGDSAAERASLTLRASLLEHNHEGGVSVSGADATIEGTVVRDTMPRPSDQTTGWGITVTSDPDSAERSSVMLVASLLEQNHEIGAIVIGSDATIEGTVVRDTNPRPLNQVFGRGIGIQHALDAAGRASVTLHASLLEHNHEVGVYVAGSDATIEGTVVRNTLPEASTQAAGRGISVQHVFDAAARASVTVRASLLQQNHDIGVVVIASDVIIEGTVVRDTMVRASDGLYGDGVVILADNPTTSALLSSCLIESNARVGLGVFGTHASLAASTLECNGIDLNQESFGGTAGAFDDQGGNRCGCGSEQTVCKAVSTGLEPPSPVGPSE